MKKISVLGLGYVGLPLACLIAKSSKYSVLGFDLNEGKVGKLKKGKSIVEDVKETDLISDFLSFSHDSKELNSTDIFIICVPTPTDKNHMPDFSYLSSAVELCAEYLTKGAMVIVESTINPGVCDDLVIPLLEKYAKLQVNEDFGVVHCPERINPGDQRWNVSNIPRNVGASHADYCREAAEFYRSFLDAEVKEMRSLQETEATKVVENTFRDINIAYVNELAKSFDIMGIDLFSVLEGASSKPFAFMPHFPGCGVGGHCIPVDPYYLIQKAKGVGFDHEFLRTARKVNNSMPIYTVDKLLNHNDFDRSKVVGIMGLSYKADIGDQRESPALAMIEYLQQQGIKTLSYDPYCLEDSGVKNQVKFLQDSDYLILATSHIQFKEISVKELEDSGIKIMVDGRNLFCKTYFNNSSIHYLSIGRA